MATLSELNTLLGDTSGALYGKIRGALLVAADGVRTNGAATAPQKLWARDVLQRPDFYVSAAYNAVLATNNTATVAAITGATDAQIQTAVTGVVAILAGG